MKTGNTAEKAKRIITVIILIGVVLLLLYCLGFNTLEAPIYYCFWREKMGAYVGTIQVSNKGGKYTCDIYKSFRPPVNPGNKQPPPQRCLALRKRFNFALLPYSGSFKITKTTIGIFNDHFTQCLPLGGYLYESYMTRSVPSVDCDMKGWGRKFKITQKGDALEYRIFSGTKEQGDIIFSVPLKFFD